MRKLFVIKINDKIVSWSSSKMSEDELEVEMTDEEYDALVNLSIIDDPMPSM